MTDGYVHFTPDIKNLSRVTPPDELLSEDEEANQLFDPVGLELTETLQVPYPGSESPFPAIRWSYDNEQHDALCNVIDNSGAGEQLSSIGGFTRPTSGEDPLPGADFIKLACFQNSIEIVLHFCVRCEDLAAGRLEQTELSWVDFD